MRRHYELFNHGNRAGTSKIYIDQRYALHFFGHQRRVDSTRTGIKSRFIATSETLCELAVKAGTMAMSQAGIAPNELDLILCSTIQGDYQTPSLSCQVQYHIGANCPAFDLNAACSGFLYGLQTAGCLFGFRRASCILLISAEMRSRYLDWNRPQYLCPVWGRGRSGCAKKGPWSKSNTP